MTAQRKTSLFLHVMQTKVSTIPPRMFEVSPVQHEEISISMGPAADKTACLIILTEGRMVSIVTPTDESQSFVTEFTVPVIPTTGKLRRFN